MKTKNDMAAADVSRVRRQGDFPWDGLTDALAACVPAVGQTDFIDRFVDAVTAAGAGQVTAFAYGVAKATCLLSRNFLAAERGGTLAAAYVDGWFRDDPLFSRVLTMTEGECHVERLEDLLPAMSQRYVSKFFKEPGFRTKRSILVSQGRLRMVLNLYFDEPIGTATAVQSDQPLSLLRLGGLLLASHYDRSTQSDHPLPLDVLSERERQVCLGMLAGKKAEIIAGEIGIGASSVITYRQRAYQKLGISSRGQLFAICRL